MKRAQELISQSEPSSPVMVPGVKRIKGRYNLRYLNDENPERYPFLLESTAISEAKASNLTRYDILFAFPEDNILLDSNLNLYQNKNLLLDDNDFLNKLDKQWQGEKNNHSTDLNIPFSGGWFIFLGYELAQQIEPRLKLSLPADGFPVAYAVRIPAAIIYDRVLDETLIITEADKSHLVTAIDTDLSVLPELSDTITSNNFSLKLKEETEQHYIDSVEKIKCYIKDGDVFQVNLSRSWKANIPSGLTASHVYQRLAQTNPAPFSGIMNFPFGSIVSSSPERLLKIKNKKVETRPIAGTRPRSKFADSDTTLKDELIAHPKERAEHIMLVDLERNDLGRICIPGTVKVDEMMGMESYAHVHHIVSNVSGTLRDEIKPGEAIRAVFPGGTITGCPKERCMAIISELEQEARSAYTGSVGYLNHNGDMDLNILIRTITMSQNELRLRTGAGIVFDSVAENELDETRHKAKGLLLALGVIDE